MKKIIIYFYDFFINWLCCLFPIKNNKIIVDNFGGKGYGDNPKYIVEELLKRSSDFDVVWQVREHDNSMPSAVRQVIKDTFKARYELLTSKVRIDNIKNGFEPFKRKGQFYIQTWHGAYGFKPIEQEIQSQLPKAYIKKGMKDSRITDVFVSANSNFTEVIKIAFWYSPTTEILESGAPRNDIYFKLDSDEKKTLKKQYGSDVKILVYAPTFRDSKKGDAYNLDVERIRTTLIEKTGNDWIVVVRLHPNAVMYADNFHYNNHVINGSFINDLQTLLCISDALITDYSSIIEDFIIMHKPIFLYVPDLDEYLLTNRNLRPLFFKQPFKLCKSNDELVNEIATYDESKYSTNLKDFLASFYVSFDDGHASERVVDKVLSLINAHSYE